MPKPLPQGAQAIYTAQALLQRPKCAELIGLICAEWSSAEYTLAIYYGSLLFGVPESGVTQVPGRWAAMQSFDTITNLATRMKMLKVAAEKLFPSMITVRFAKLLKDLQDVQARRIVAAHGRWGISEQLPDEVTYQKCFGDMPEVYSTNDLTVSLCEITEASDALFSFFDSTMKPALKTLAENWFGNRSAVPDVKDGV